MIWVILLLINQIRFTDISSQAGINITALGSSVAFFDYNNDNLEDLFISVQLGSAYLFRNNGNGTFTDVTASSGLSGIQVRGVAFADYNNDGYLDLLCTRFGSSTPYLFLNNRNGTFTDVATSAGLLSGYNSWHGIFGDFNRDGHIDIFMGNWATTDYLYRSNGNGTFTEIGVQAGVSRSGSNYKPSTWFDYNNDLWPDLYVGNGDTNRLYRNNSGVLPFTDVTRDARLGDSLRCSGVSVGDYNNDGFFDIYEGNIGGGRNFLYRNNGNGTFTDVTLSAGVGDVGDGRTCYWIDYDQDGLQDIFTSNHVNPNRLYRNNGNGTFTDMAPSTNIAGPTDVFACSWADFDGDGDMDVFLSGHGVNGPTNALMRIDGITNHYLKVRLVGMVSNKAGIGARLKLSSGTLHQYREVNGGTGSEEQSSIIQHFGLGTRIRWDSLRINWPSGIIDRLYNLRADTTLVIVEGMTGVNDRL
ncbi:MAG: CRTAC1 family protein, partial [candidate division WOR-3 bacterium]